MKKLVAVLLMGSTLAFAGDPEKLTTEELATVSNANLVLKNTKLAAENAALAEENAKLRYQTMIANIRAVHKLGDSDEWSGDGLIKRAPAPKPADKKAKAK